MRMYCLDTYALVEISNGNPFYSFLLNEPFVILDLTISEFYDVILKKHGLEAAEHRTKEFLFCCVSAEVGTLLGAVRFRREHKALNLSFFDAAGYVFSQENGHAFVTGDAAFKGMKGVKFIK